MAAKGQGSSKPVKESQSAKARKKIDDSSKSNPEKRRRVGRPAKADLNDPRIVDRICNLLITGKGINKIGRRKDCPSADTIYLRMASDEVFRNRIARAREAQQEAFSEENIDLADKATPENWQVKRLQIWARQWHMGKLSPSKYGPHIAVEPPRPVDPLDDLRKALLATPLAPGQVNE